MTRSSSGLKSSHSDEYREVRDMILERLSSAFKGSASEKDQSFLSFIGYPPVLDSIVTLLREEPNYHKLKGQLSGTDVNDVEVQLLHRIATYIFRREKEDKVVPNILSPLISELPPQDIVPITERVFEPYEQCMRLVSHCLGKQVTLEVIGTPLLDEKYEAQLVSFLPEHPFVTGRDFRNAIFEAVTLSVLIMSAEADAVQLALEYADRHKYNYHLIYLLHKIVAERPIPIAVLPVIIGAALEFRSRTASVEISIEGPDVEQLSGASQTIDIEIEIITGTTDGQTHTFTFQSDIKDVKSVGLNRSLSSTFVSLPCEVVISSAQELEFTVPVEVSATKITLQAPALILRPPMAVGLDRHVLLEADVLSCALERIATNGLELELAVTDRSGLGYPVIQYVKQRGAFTHDRDLQEKYLRLRRILFQFRSHSRGTMARYKQKIEHEHVLKNALGKAILDRLLHDGVLTLDGSFYFLQPENVNKHLGISWIDLRKGRTSTRLEQYLRLVV